MRKFIMTRRRNPLWMIFLSSVIFVEYVRCRQATQERIPVERSTESPRLEPKMARVDLNAHTEEEHKILKQRLETLENSLDQLTNEIKARVPLSKLNEYRRVINDLSRQVAMQQLFVEERIRSDGNSGIKQVRSMQQGTKAYYSQTVVADSAGSIHDHSNYERTVGLGELDVVMNGVEFKTRHNDYGLMQPSSSDSKYHATKPIEFPLVPPEVLNKTTIGEQIREMRMFFQAFRDQNSSLRNYKPYFPAVLCYLEGAWTQTKSDGSVEEPFNSTRHKIDAKSWYDLQEKIWFTASNGRKDDNENYAFLPTTIAEFTDDGPRYAQWNYRVLCHKLTKDLPKKTMRVVDDLATRIQFNWTLRDLLSNRQARFQLVGPLNGSSGERILYPNSLLDHLMYQIPGKNNYGTFLNDSSQYFTMGEVGSSQYLNAAYYNRHFESKRGAMGSTSRRRGFSDDFLFTALTTHEEIVPRGVRRCYGVRGCKIDYQRVTYAIPMEIIYLNPLQSWNPFNLTVHANSAIPQEGNRNGHNTTKEAFNGTSRNHNYKTPAAFYGSQSLGQSSRSADTVKGSVGVLTSKGEVKDMVSSGIKILLESIPGVGGIRQRFPIFPVHQESSHEWIHLEALKAIVYHPDRYQHLIVKPEASPTSPSQKFVKMYTNVGSEPFPHDHTLTLDAEQIKLLNQGQQITVVTDEKEALLSHRMQMYIKSNIRGKVVYGIAICDGKPNKCSDGHSEIVRDG